MLKHNLQDLLAWDRTHVWHAFTQMAEYEPFVVERAEGCVLTDIDGNHYIDGVSSLWCNIHGHRHPRIDAAIRQQLDKVAHFTNLGGSTPPAIRLAKRLADIAPPSLPHVFFCGDGASAVEAALKMAFQYWRQRCNSQATAQRPKTDEDGGGFRNMAAHDGKGVHRKPPPSPLPSGPRPEKDCFLALGHAYHGDTIGAVSVGGIEQFHAMFRPLLFETIRVPAPDTYRTPPEISRENLCQYYLNQLEEELKKSHSRIAAMVIEPLVQGAAGLLMHPSGYLRGARELTRKYDVLLIADEVAVGFGRTGRMFACEHEGVTPDLLCLGKGLTGGYLPMSATLATDDIWNAFLGAYSEGKTFFHGHTYGGNPLCAAAALATLDVFDEEQTFEKLPVKIARLQEHLARIAKLPHVGDVRQCGLMAGIELVRDVAAKEPYPWQQRRGKRVCDHALSEGVWIRPLGDVVVILPPLSISLEQIDQIADAVERGISEATQ